MDADPETQFLAKHPGYHGSRCSFILSWKNGVLSSGSAKMEPIYRCKDDAGKPITVASEQELVGGAAHGL